MQRAPALPFLPGFNFDTNLGRTKFHRKQYFRKIHEGVYYLAEKGDETNKSPYPNLYAPGETPDPPAWLSYDRQRLMFKAYFQETVHEMWNTPYQVRVVKISFFLEDGTIKVAEPPVDNSGLEQGVLVRRARIPKPGSLKYRYYDILDLNIGKEPEIFGRVYKIVDCDPFTRRFLNRMGIPVPEPLEIPKDPHTELSRNENFAKKPNPRVDTRGDFLKYDRHVLRFYGYWDDTESLYGIIHDLEIHYYLADKTLQVKQIIHPNSGLDAGGMLVKRMKVPKFFEGLEPIGVSDPFTILNVLGEDTSGSYYMTDALNSGKIRGDYYKDSDFYIGAEINVFGRKIVLTDMDEFTKDHYRKHYGIEEFTPLPRPLMKEEIPQKTEKYIPPYNGYGSYEDSLGNCFSVLPKPPKADFVKFLYYDKQGFDSHVLRFRARLISNVPVDQDRIFIIRVFLMDDTISIFELARRNSGFIRSTFQKRMPVMLPGQDIYSSKKPDYYKPEDFYIGARLSLNDFLFELTSADTYALRYMELNSNKFLRANIKLIMNKIREALKPIYKDFSETCTPPKSCQDIFPVWKYADLKEAMCKYLGDNITEHELITIARHYSAHVDKEFCSREYVRRLMHTELLRLLWDELDRLEEDLHHCDRDRTGFLSRDTVYTILRGCRIPVDVELLNSMLDHLKKNEEGKIDYNDMLRFMDVKIDPVTPASPINIKTALWWASEKAPDCGAGIDWCAFLKDLELEENQQDDTPTCTNPTTCPEMQLALCGNR